MDSNINPITAPAPSAKCGIQFVHNTPSLRFLSVHYQQKIALKFYNLQIVRFGAHSENVYFTFETDNLKFEKNKII